MTLQEMINAINRRIDDVIDTADAIEWLNEGQNLLAIAVGAKFPQLSSNLTDTFVFDEKYHTIPVIFAAMRYKEQDSSLQEARYLMDQFEEYKREFVENYEVPPRYRDDRQTQQFTATDGQTTFTITKLDYDPNSGDLKVYVNDAPVPLAAIGWDKSFTLETPCSDGDAVTAVWEIHTDMQEPPYPWWRW
jgi:hypothetical protein